MVRVHVCMCMKQSALLIILQGHPRLFILPPIESAYGTSYCSSIVTWSYLAPFQRHIRAFLRRKPIFFLAAPLFRALFRAKFWVFPLE